MGLMSTCCVVHGEQPARESAARQVLEHATAQVARIARRADDRDPPGLEDARDARVGHDGHLLWRVLQGDLRFRLVRIIAVNHSRGIRPRRGAIVSVTMLAAPRKARTPAPPTPPEEMVPAHVEPGLPPLRAENVSAALSDKNSRRMLATCVDVARSAKDLSIYLDIPLASVYRQIHRLASLDVLVVERSAMTAEGKKYDLYRSRLREAHLEFTSEREEVSWIPNGPVERRLIGLWDAVRVRARRPS